MSFLSQPVTFQSIFGGPSRKIDDIAVNCVISEDTNDTLTVTRQPIQNGASISDHAYKEPTTLSMTAYFTDNLTDSLMDIYDDLQVLQEARTPFDIVTPKRIYKSMLMTTLINHTDAKTENVLSISMTFEEIIIVSVTTTGVPRIAQSLPAKTQAIQPAGNVSVLRRLTNAIGLTK